MSTTVVIILTALVTAIGGYLLNQLPEVRQFRGRNWLIIRLFVWITLLPVIYELLTADDVLAQVKAMTRYGLVVIVVFLVLDLWKLVTVLRGRTNSSEEGVPQDLRTLLLQALQGEVAERLEDSLNQQVVINLLMQQQLNQGNRPDKQKRISLEEIEKKQAESNLILLPRRSLKRDEQSTKLDPQESIFETFNRRDVGRKLLILGAPGSGKTTTLLKLAESLVEEALQEGQQLIPIIFELSTWKENKQSIHDWLIEQLKLNYNIDLKTGAKWLKETYLLPLLDGLDELGLQRQALCVEKINEFVKGLAYPHVVVCCRSEEYAEGRVSLGALKGAVCLEPLGDNQIRRYFCEQLGQPEIWQAIRQQSGLRGLLEPSPEREIGILRIPLFLTILSVAYGDEISIESDKDLFNAYIHRRLELDTRKIERAQFRRDWAYKTVEQEPDDVQTRRYLNWLARTLNSDNAVELLIERIQPRWLETKRQKWAYRLIGGLIFGLIGGLKADFQIREKPNQGMWAVVFNVPLIALFSYPGAVAILYLPTWILGNSPSLSNSLLSGIIYTLIFGIFLGGGSELIQHFSLRTILTHTGNTPWNYARFLNYCAERRLLQRIGGRYRFIHRELLDHYAEM